MHPLSETQALTAIGAMKAVAAADGEIEEHERALLVAAARALGLADVDLDALPSPTPEEAAAVFPDPEARTRLLQAMLVAAIMDGRGDPAEEATVARWARVLGVDDPRLGNLHQFVHRYHRLAVLDLLRRTPVVTDSMAAAWRHDGVIGAWRFVASFQGLYCDAALAKRFRDLEHLPADTFGRAYWEHITANGFAFPGERGGFPPELVKHDVAHVLGGYPTTPIGECEVVAFVSGFMKNDPFSYLFMIAVHYQIGVEVFQGTPVVRFAFDPEPVIRALRRGMAVNRDLYDPELDFWPWFPLPLEHVRREFGVLPA